MSGSTMKNQSRIFKLIISQAVMMTFFIVGGPLLTNADERNPHIVLMIGESEYETDASLTNFVQKELIPRNFRCTFVRASEEDKNHFPGLEALKDADLLILSVRRRTPKKEELDLVRNYLKSGKPIVGIRTANHAFCQRKKDAPEGLSDWKTFDPDVFKGSYTNHYSNKLKTTVFKNQESANDPILKNVGPSSWITTTSLYCVAPLGKPTNVLLYGNVLDDEGKIMPDKPKEPIAWTTEYHGGRVFYTSLGNTRDFTMAPFNHLLLNAIHWALDQPAPEKLLQKLPE